MLKERADGFHIHRVHPWAEYHAVGVAHVHTGDGILPAADVDRVVHHLLLREPQAQRRRVQRGIAHGDAGGGDLAVHGIEPHGFDAGLRLHGEDIFFHDASIVEVLSHAPQGVARHLALAAVPVEHPHFRVGLVGALHQHDAVRAHAVMPVAEGNAQGFRAGNGFVKVFQEKIVIAAGLHFGKGQLLPLPAQMADVHQLRVALIVAGGQNVRQGGGGVQRGQARNAKLHRPVIQVDKVPDIGRFGGAGEDNIVNFSRF